MKVDLGKSHLRHHQPVAFGVSPPSSPSLHSLSCMFDMTTPPAQNAAGPSGKRSLSTTTSSEKETELLPGGLQNPHSKGITLWQEQAVERKTLRWSQSRWDRLEAATAPRWPFYLDLQHGETNATSRLRSNPSLLSATEVQIATWVSLGRTSWRSRWDTCNVWWVCLIPQSY